ncbi:hypothetical protein ACLKA7_011387 [Drosophila subpalustris]
MSDCDVGFDFEREQTKDGDTGMLSAQPVRFLWPIKEALLREAVCLLAFILLLLAACSRRLRLLALTLARSWAKAAASALELEPELELELDVVDVVSESSVVSVVSVDSVSIVVDSVVTVVVDATVVQSSADAFAESLQSVQPLGKFGFKEVQASPLKPRIRQMAKMAQLTIMQIAGLSLLCSCHNNG